MRVVAVDDASVWVEAPRVSGCDDCAVRTSCGTRVLADHLTSDDPLLRLERAGDVQIGDQVVVSLPTRVFMTSVGLGYLLPPTTLVVTAVAASLIGASDLTAAILALPFFLLSFLPLRLAERRGTVTRALRIEKVIAAPGGAGSLP